MRPRTARPGSGRDYRATSGTLTFSAGQTSQRVSVPVLDDDLDEGSETLTLTLSNPSPLQYERGGPDRDPGRSPTPTGCRRRGSRASGARWPSRYWMRWTPGCGQGRSPAVRARLAGQRIGVGPLFGVGSGGDAASGEDRTREREAGAQRTVQDLANRLRAARRSGIEFDARRPSDRQSGSGCRLEIRERSGFGRGRGPVGSVGSRARPAGRFVLLAHQGNPDARNRLPVGTRRRYPLRRPRGQPVARRRGRERHGRPRLVPGSRIPARRPGQVGLRGRAPGPPGSSSRTASARATMPATARAASTRRSPASGPGGALRSPGGWMSGAPPATARVSSR